MEEELVSGSTFQNNGGSQGQENGRAAPVSYSEIFRKHLPFYLSIGMTADEFWNKDCTLVKSYREAFEMERARQNEMLWLQGAYIYDALCAASPLLRTSFGKGEVKSLPYTKEPYPITKAQVKAKKKRDEEEKIKAAANAFQEMAAAFNKSFEKKNQENKEVTDDAGTGNP